MEQLPENFRATLGPPLRHGLKVARYEKDDDGNDILVVADLVDIEQISSAVQRMFITGVDKRGRWWKLVTLPKHGDTEPNPWKLLDEQ